MNKRDLEAYAYLQETGDRYGAFAMARPTSKAKEGMSRQSSVSQWISYVERQLSQEDLLALCGVSKQSVIAKYVELSKATKVQGDTEVPDTKIQLDANDRLAKIVGLLSNTGDAPTVGNVEKVEILNIQVKDMDEWEKIRKISSH